MVQAPRPPGHKPGHRLTSKLKAEVPSEPLWGFHDDPQSLPTFSTMIQGHLPQVEKGDFLDHCF